jgi:hypothetical protein
MKETITVFAIVLETEEGAVYQPVGGGGIEVGPVGGVEDVCPAGLALGVARALHLLRSALPCVNALRRGDAAAKAGDETSAMAHADVAEREISKLEGDS